MEQISLQLFATAGTISPNPVNSDESGAFNATYTAPSIAGSQTVEIVAPFHLSTPVSVLPVMSSVQPAIGTVAGGQPATVQGAGFAQNATGITFKTTNSSRPATAIQVPNSSQVGFLTPPSPLPGDGTGTAVVTSTVNGVESFGLEYLYVVPGKPVLNYDPPHLNPLTFQCTEPAVTVTAYAANGQAEQVLINLSASYPAFPGGNGATTSATASSGQTIAMLGTGPITAVNSRAPSLSVTEQFPDILLPPPQCSQRTFPVHAPLSSASAVSFVPHLVTACASCSPDVKPNSTVWWLSDKTPAEAGAYVGMKPQGTESPADEFDIQSVPLTQTSPGTKIRIKLYNGKKARAVVIGPVISILPKGQPRERSNRIPQYATIHLPLPVGASESRFFHIVYSPKNSKHD